MYGVKEIFNYFLTRIPLEIIVGLRVADYTNAKFFLKRFPIIINTFSGEFYCETKLMARIIGNKTKGSVDGKTF